MEFHHVKDSSRKLPYSSGNRCRAAAEYMLPPNLAAGFARFGTHVYRIQPKGKVTLARASWRRGVCVVFQKLLSKIKGAKADSSTHHPQTEVRLGPRSLRMTARFVVRAVHHPQTPPPKRRPVCGDPGSTFGAPFAQDDTAAMMRTSETRYQVAQGKISASRSAFRCDLCRIRSPFPHQWATQSQSLDHSKESFFRPRENNNR